MYLTTGDDVVKVGDRKVSYTLYIILAPMLRDIGILSTSIAPKGSWGVIWEETYFEDPFITRGYLYRTPRKRCSAL